MTMKAPKLGLITFGDERPHEWEKVFRPVDRRQTR